MTLKPSLQNKLNEQRQIVEQLKKEALYQPMNTSIVIKDLITYVEQNQKYDVLASGFSSLNDNPYKEKTGCNLL